MFQGPDLPDNHGKAGSKGCFSLLSFCQCLCLPKETVVNKVMVCVPLTDRIFPSIKKMHKMKSTAEKGENLNFSEKAPEGIPGGVLQLTICQQTSLGMHEPTVVGPVGKVYKKAVHCSSHELELVSPNLQECQ